MCSCSNKKESAIIDRIQTIDGRKFDLDIKIISMQEEDDLTAADSMSSLQLAIEEYKFEKGRPISDQIILLSETLARRYERIAMTGYESVDIKKENQLLEDSIKKLNSTKEKIDNGDIDDDGYISLLEKKILFEKDTSRILAKRVKCTFSFMNPELKVREEVTKIFLLTLDGKKAF
jgi:hypothetical protein